MDKLMEIDDLLHEWHTGIWIRHIAHNMSCVRYTRMHRLLGVPVVIVSAFVGTSIFASLGSTTDHASQIITGLLSVAAAVLASLQTFLGYSELAEKHYVIAVEYGALRRQVEEWEACHKFPCEEMSEVISKFRSKWDAVDKEAPAIPVRIHTLATEKVSRGLIEERLGK